MSDPLTSDDLALLSALSPGANVRQASLALGLPRSTLSRHLAELEARLGRSLFLRRGRALTPTRYGEEVMRCAAKAHAAWHELRAAASADSERFVLAAAPLFAEHVVPALLSHLLAEQSTLRVELLLSHRFEDIFSERIDLALRRGPAGQL